MNDRTKAPGAPVARDALVRLPAVLTDHGPMRVLACLVLLLKAQLAMLRPYKRTEVWLLLKPEERPQAAIAQQIIGTVMRETFLYFALHAGVAAAGCLFLSLVLRIAH